MRRFIALLLLAVMCLSFVACGNEAKKEIVGTWVTEDQDESFAFNEDGSGTYDDGRYHEDGIRWKYDEELSRYILCCPYSEMYHIFVETDENGARYFTYGKTKYYYQDK